MLRARRLAWWALVGVGVGFGVSAIGLFTVPAALILTVVLVRRGYGGREAFAALVGAALLPAFVAVFNRGYDPLYWSLAAAVLAALGVGGYWLSRRIAA